MLLLRGTFSYRPRTGLAEILTRRLLLFLWLLLGARGFRLVVRVRLLAIFWHVNSVPHASPDSYPCVFPTGHYAEPRMRQPPFPKSERVGQPTLSRNAKCGLPYRKSEGRDSPKPLLSRVHSRPHSGAVEFRKCRLLLGRQLSRDTAHPNVDIVGPIPI